MITATLGELTSTTRPICYGVLKPGKRVDGGIPLVRVTDISGNFFDSSALYTISSELDNEFRRSRLRGNELLISIQGTVGRIAVCPPEFAGANISRTIAVIDPDIRVDRRYLYWYLRNINDKGSFGTVGSTRASLNIGVLRRISITLLPLAEQKRIAGILDAADALRAKRRDALAQLDSLLQATFLDLFGDPINNPKGFPVRTLSEFYVSARDGTKCGPFGSALKKDEFVDSGVPVWNMDNIDPAGRMVMPFRSWITPAKYEELKSYAVHDGDVLISRAGTVGKMCVARSGSLKSIISTNLIRVRFGRDLLPIHFVSLMIYCKGRVGRLKVGPDGAFTHMSTGVLDDLAFPYPPIEMQRRFDLIAEAIEKQKQTHRNHLAELDTLFASLQSRAFRGEL